MSKALKIWSVLVGCLVAVASITGIYAVKQKERANPAAQSLLRPEDRALIERGAAKYLQNCASCHGADLKGEPDWQSLKPDGTLPAPPHDESGHTWHHSDELLINITKHGTADALGLNDFKSNMPAFDGILDDEEIIAVLSWIKAQWPEEMRNQHDRINESVGAAGR